MDGNQMTALDAFVNRVYKIIVIIIPIFCICASVTILTLHYLGFYPVRSTVALWLFSFSDFVYLLVGIYFAKTGFDEKGIIIPRKLTMAKYVMAIIVLIQWNGISYIWPYRDFWAFCVLFVIVQAFYFDIKLVVFSTTTIIISMVISWFVNGEYLLPNDDEFFVVNMVFRLVGIMLMLLSINIITYFGGKYLVEELEKYVNYDALTHLLNRRSMDNYLKAAFKQAQTGQTTFCLLMMDIDDFKRVNDTYGHDCGDEVLKYVANTIATGVKKNDSVFRWGGEEILVIMAATLEQSASAAERIRRDVEKDPINYRDEAEVSVTITIGISPYTTGATIQKMMDDADAKLYYGKKHGKNQVVTTL